MFPSTEDRLRSQCKEFYKGETVLGFLIMEAVCTGIWLLWRPVAKRARSDERRLVFWGMVVQGVMILVKLFMLVAIVTIPLLNRVGLYGLYEYRYVDQGIHKGEYVLMHLKMNGQWEDIYGNKYDL